MAGHLKKKLPHTEKCAKSDGLELEHFGKWIIVYEGKLRGVFNTQNEAVISAVKKFRDNAFLIKQVGATESLYRRGLPTVSVSCCQDFWKQNLEAYKAQ